MLGFTKKQQPPHKCLLVHLKVHSSKLQESKNINGCHLIILEEKLLYPDLFSLTWQAHCAESVSQITQTFFPRIMASVFQQIQSRGFRKEWWYNQDEGITHNLGVQLEIWVRGCNFGVKNPHMELWGRLLKVLDPVQIILIKQYGTIVGRQFFV